MQEKRYTCLNGRFVLAHRAAVPVTDRGFRFGDGVFETIRLCDGVPYQWELHMARMSQGLAALRIPAPDIDWQFYARKLIHKHRAREGYLRVAVSRGTGSRGYLPFPAAMPAFWVIEYLPPLPNPAHPLRVWLSAIARIPPQALPVHCKLAQGVNNTLALLEAQENHCDEALQLSSNGFICEAASANIFWIKNDQVSTPSLDTGCLAGTTRDAVLRLSPVPIRMVADGIHALRDADAVFLSNSRLGVWPVSTLAPMGWEFNVHHPLLARLRAMVELDRTNDAARNRQHWIA